MRKIPSNSLVLNMSDIAGSFPSIAKGDIPPVPDSAVRYDYPDGHRDVIFDEGNQRWRFRHGNLVGYITYGEADGRKQISGMYCDGY
jgi:hypothetical protein